MSTAELERLKSLKMPFAELLGIELVAATRDLVAGTVIGSGTVANANHAEVGSSCISERRAIEIIADGKPTSRFMRFGDRCRMHGTAADGRAVFGTIEQEVVAAAGHAT